MTVDSKPVTTKSETETPLAQRAMLANIRHELRTPLNAIIGYSEMLIEDCEDAGNDLLIPDLTRILASGKELLRMVNDILDPEKINAGQIDTDIGSVSAMLRHQLLTPLNAITGFCEMLLEDAQDKELSDITPDLNRIHAAAQRFSGLLNDIVNFAKIEESIKESPSEALTEAVSPLAAAIIVPLSDKEAVPLVKYSGEILVVDDNETNRDLLTRHLEREGHTVQSAENGRQAIEIMTVRPFDLVLLDIMMPVMDGYQALEKIKKNQKLRNIPVIMISALDEMDSIIRCIETGAEDYLPKPFDPVLLRARINACLEKKKLRDQEVLYLHQIETEKKRSDDLLHVILPHEIVQELKLSDAVKPRHYKNVAVLFTDVVGFTPYCDAHTPEDVLVNLQMMVEAFEEIAIRHDLQKIKTIGDAFMAVAGLLKPADNPVYQCVKSGQEMISAMKQLPSGWKIRIGIHFGAVMAGVVGHRQYLFDVWGDTVNTAQRIESRGIPDAVCLSRLAWDNVSDLFDGESMGVIDLKGKGSLELYRIQTV